MLQIDEMMYENVKKSVGDWCKVCVDFVVKGLDNDEREGIEEIIRKYKIKISKVEKQNT